MSNTDSLDTFSATSKGEPGPRVNLENISLEEILTLQDTLEAKRRAVVEERKRRAVAQFLTEIQAIRVPLAEVLPLIDPRAILSTEKRQAKGAKVGDGGAEQRLPIMFQDPENPENVWRERGQKPTWLQDYEAQGRDAEEFRIRPPVIPPEKRRGKKQKPTDRQLSPDGAEAENAGPLARETGTREQSGM